MIQEEYCKFETCKLLKEVDFPQVDDYIVAFDSGNVCTAHYTQHRDKWHDRSIANNCNTSNIIAWMEFPNPPKELITI